MAKTQMLLVLILLLLAGCSVHTETGVLAKVTASKNCDYSNTYDLEFADGTKWTNVRNYYNLPWYIGYEVEIVCKTDSFNYAELITIKKRSQQIVNISSQSLPDKPQINLQSPSLSEKVLFRAATKVGDITITENEYNHNYLGNQNVKIADDSVLITTQKKE